MVNRDVVGAHYGLRDWLAQRLTAIVMTLYSVLFILILLGAPGVVLGPLIVAVSLTLLEIWRQRTAEPMEVA